jgi:hypothetical protein
MWTAVKIGLGIAVGAVLAQCVLAGLTFVAMLIWGVP